MDAVHSGTGVFYQAMPAFGADGKNIMKLIPVKMVNGQFAQNQISMPGMGSIPQKAVTVNISSAPVQMVDSAALNSSATQRVVRNQVSFVNALPQHKAAQQTVDLMANVPLIATHCGNSLKLPRQLPVTVTSPALPSGQHLKIPPNAQVRTVPASELPPGIKNQIFTPSANSSSDSGSHNVVYVSPVTAVKQGFTPPCDSAPHPLKLLSKTSNKTSREPPAKGSKPLLKLIPKATQRPNSPIKWVIEEEESSTAPSLNPLSCPSVTSEILKAVAERENLSRHCDVIQKKVSQSSQEKSGQGQENASVMCNGKVFFLTQKCSLPFQKGKSDAATAATKHYEINKTILPSAQKCLESVAAQTQEALRITIPDESDEVIDLCDDDAQDGSSQKAASVNMSAGSHPDDDNVIFVSYIPPKSEAGSTNDLILKTQMALEKETDKTGTTSWNSAAEERSLAGRTGGDGRDEGSTPTERPGQSILVTTVKNVSHVCGSAVMNMHDNKASNMKSQQSTSIQQEDRMEVDAAADRPAGPSIPGSISGTRSQRRDTHRVESIPNPAPCLTSSLAPKPCQVADHLLRQIFGITADVKVSLQRIDEASAESVPAQPRESELRSSMEDHQEPENGLKDKDPLGQKLYRSHKKQNTVTYNNLISVKTVKVLFGQELSGDPATAAPHTDITPLKYALFKLKTKPLSALSKCHSGQSSLKGMSCDIENAPLTGYMEPIDEDFSSTDANYITESQDTEAQLQPQTFVDLNTNTRRIGRTRKRTMCPCCIAGTLEPAVKSSTRSDKTEKWARMLEQMSKKGGQTKAPRKDGKTAISCLTSKNQQKCETDEVPASDSSSTTSMDSVELKGHKQVKRLQEPVKDKEAALEVMANCMS